MPITDLFGPSVSYLVKALRCLPGVGPKSAQRMAFHLLESDREGGIQLANALLESLDKVTQCQSCRILNESLLCSLCASTDRNHSQLCIVEMPSDVQAIEQTTAYQGLYFVLMGHLSPLDGIGPETLGMDLLIQRLEIKKISEIILATNLTVEGEATAYYIDRIAKKYNIATTRIAHGVPIGGELEFVDANTLSYAFKGRKHL
ncbi:recombination mediator RecR [Candidatus Nitrosacidococcus sp. I8]|uniref:recombination mediator RecR n=1 Tax=Candidatus Nitrosacidococcus sp. I8 TaxID=2942908 RepID=UPI0022280D01|nr:recombination mediator RecR [Candidatus Nitrosacidococcus sp. I8]CAH9019697.1 Recombination protein RecR [Candidatus Nitrosacidococcus sp. I8]